MKIKQFYDNENSKVNGIYMLSEVKNKEAKYLQNSDFACMCVSSSL